MSSDDNSTSGGALDLDDLRTRLAEAEEVLRAIREGDVDAVVVHGKQGDQVYTLSGADRVYRHLIETINEGAVILSVDGTILYCNARLARILDRPLHKIMGTVLRDHLPSTDRQLFDSALARARTEPSRQEIRLETSTGRLVPVYLSASRLQTDEPEMISCIVLTDLTEQKSHQKILADERLARSILEQAAEAIVVCDERGIVIRASEAAREVCGRSPLLLAFAEAFPLQQGESGPFDLSPVLRGETLRNLEVALRGPERMVHMILNAGPLVSDHGILGCVVTLTDVTRHVHLEAQFRQSQKMEVVGRLAGGIAHDFNNLLTVINGTADLAKAGLAEGDPLHAELQEIARAGERAALLTRQLLAFSRKQVMSFEPVNLGALVGGVDRMLRRIIGEDISLVITSDGRPGTILGDPGQIEQVVMNLAVNARDAMPNGGRLTIDTREVTLDPARVAEHPGLAPGRYVLLAVSDTGVGMDEATRAQIFEPFFTTKEAGKGTGLGLSTVYGIIKQSGGSISVHSEPEKGTTFEIYLPRSEEVAVERRSAPVASSMRGEETVLVVEDEEMVRRLAERVLAAAGYAVLTANDGPEALAVLARHEGPVHLMITDMVMPRMTGRDLAEHLEKRSSRTRVLFTSGYTDDAILQRGLPDKGSHFIGKPYSVGDLKQKVREVLDAPEGATPSGIRSKHPPGEA